MAFLLAVTAAVTAGVSAGVPTGAQALPRTFGPVVGGAIAPTWSVPGRPAAGARLTLVAASTEATLVRQEHVVGLLWARAGGRLAAVSPPPGSGATELVGTRMFEALGTGVAVTDLPSGTRTIQSLGGRRFLAADPEGVVGWDPVAGTVDLIVGASTTTLLSGVGTVDPADVVAAAGRVVVGYHPRGVPSWRPLTTVLLELRTGARQPVLDPGMPLLADGVVGGWTGWNSGYSPTGSTTLSVRRTSGGPARTLDVAGRLLPPVAFAGGAAFVDPAGYLTLMPVGGGPAVHTAVGGVTGIATAGAVVRVVRSGPSSRAGIWTIGPDGRPHRDVPALPVPAPVLGVSVASGRLLVSRDDGLDAGPTLDAWLIARTSTDPPGVALKPARPTGWSTRHVGVTGAGRTSVYRFFDAGRPLPATGNSWLNGATSSGPYLETTGGIVRADGVRIPSVTALGDPMADKRELFGPLLLHRSWDGSVTVQDLRVQTPPAVPKVVRPAACEAWWLGNSCSKDALLLRGSAVVLPQPGQVVIHDLSTGAERVFAADPDAHSWSGTDTDRDVTVNDGAVMWTGPDGTSQRLLLDVGAGATRPVPLRSVLPPGAPQDAYLGLDAGVAAWQGPRETVLVAPLRGTRPHRPVLVGALAATAFSPDGDGVEDVWRPEFDLTKPLARSRVVIRRDRVVIRSLAAPTGAAVRGIGWDGTDAAGRPVPDGTYQWQLIGVSADGAGVPDGGPGLVGPDGRGSVAGTVTLRRSTAPVAVSFGSARDPRSGPSQVVVRWRPVEASALSTSRRTTYDVRVRHTSSWPADPAPGEGDLWLEATSRRSATWTAPPATDLPRDIQVSVRARDDAGAVGPWGPWIRHDLPSDDSWFVAGEGSTWTRTAVPGAYGGTELRTDSPGSAVTASFEGDGFTILGTNCPRCGRLEVWVDDELRTRVNTRSGRASTRKVLFSSGLPWGEHKVRVVAVGGQIGVDALVGTGG